MAVGADGGGVDGRQHDMQPVVPIDAHHALNGGAIFRHIAFQLHRLPILAHPAAEPYRVVF